MSALAPPNPAVCGWHYVQRWDDPAQAWWWDASARIWIPPPVTINAGSRRTSEAHASGWRYLAPIPSIDQLTAMGEIVAICAAAMAKQDGRFRDETADEGVIWKPFPLITAGMIRRAVGEG